MALNSVLDAMKPMPSCMMFAGVMTGFDDIGLSFLRLIWKAQNLLRRGSRGQMEIHLWDRGARLPRIGPFLNAGRVRQFLVWGTKRKLGTALGERKLWCGN